MGVRRARSPFAPLLSADVVPVHLLQAGLGRDPLSLQCYWHLPGLAGPKHPPPPNLLLQQQQSGKPNTGPATHLGVRVRVMRS